METQLDTKAVRRTRADGAERPRVAVGRMCLGEAGSTKKKCVSLGSSISPHQNLVSIDLMN